MGSVISEMGHMKENGKTITYGYFNWSILTENKLFIMFMSKKAICK